MPAEQPDTTTPRPTIDPDRLATFLSLTITTGSHELGENGEPLGYCVEEADAFLAGEPHSDSPACVCSSIRAVKLRFNDRCGVGPIADARRRRLATETYLVSLGSAGSPELAKRRGILALDWSVRVAIPRILRRLPSLVHWADKLSSLPELRSEEDAAAARKMFRDIRGDAWRARSDAWAHIRKAAVALAAAVEAESEAAVEAAVAAVAVAESAAESAAVAAVAAAAESAAVAAVAAAVAAVVEEVVAVATVAESAAVVVAAVAAVEPGFLRMVAAAQVAKDRGGDWRDMRSAAWGVATELHNERGWILFERSPWIEEREATDGEFIALIHRMAALTDDGKQPTKVIAEEAPIGS